MHQRKVDSGKSWYTYAGHMQLLRTQGCHRCRHFLKLLRADVRTVREAKVQQSKFAEQVSAAECSAFMINQLKGPSDCCLTSCLCSTECHCTGKETGFADAAMW